VKRLGGFESAVGRVSRVISDGNSGAEIMRTGKKIDAVSPCSEIVEILFTDTAKSQELFKKFNSAEKAKAQGLLKAQFSKACVKHGGKIHTWNGDGGFAFFPSKTGLEFGNSVEAAKDFLESIPRLNEQTALAFCVQEFTRNVRISAHRGEIYITGEAGLDSADPKEFDAFIKGEKKIAPDNDEVFITSQLHSVLGANAKNMFQFYKRVRCGSLLADIYRLKKAPMEKTHNILKREEALSTITESEWTHLKSEIFAKCRNVAARNQITKGLIRRVWQNKGLSYKDIFELTLDSLHVYLNDAFRKHKIRITYWRCSREKSGDEILTIVGHRYPKGEDVSNPSRVVCVKDQHYQVCRAFSRKEVLVTPSVVSARNAKMKLWFDFYNGQANKKRHLASAMQIPVYHRVEKSNEKNVFGVLCLDADKPDTFLEEEIPMWIDDLVGYLVNISLSESILQHSVSL